MRISWGMQIPLYVDESVHDKLRFIATAFVFSGCALDEVVSMAIRSVGMRPGVNEFKSGAFMAANSAMRALRENLLQIAANETKIALVFSSSRNRASLGLSCLHALESVLRRNGIAPDSVTAHFDEGIFGSTQRAFEMQAANRFLSELTLYPEQDSRVCFGIQVADAVAHLSAQIVREALSGEAKMVNIGGPGTGYSDDTEAPLGWALLMSIRYSFFSRPQVLQGEIFDPETNPIVIGPDDDPVDVGINPELVGWGVQVAEDAPTPVHEAVVATLGKIWLGCIH